MEKGILIDEIKRLIDFTLKDNPSDACVFVNPEIYHQAIEHIKGKGYTIGHIESCCVDGRVAVFLKNKDSDFDWNKFRTETATSIMQTMIGSKHWEEQMVGLTEALQKRGQNPDPCIMYADAAINFTDALIMKLREK